MCRWWVFGVLLHWLNPLQSRQLLGSALGHLEFPPRSLAIEDARHSILDSFNKLDRDAYDSKALSSFSDELAFAVLGVLHNLSAACTFA